MQQARGVPGRSYQPFQAAGDGCTGPQTATPTVLQQGGTAALHQAASQAQRG